MSDSFNVLSDICFNGELLSVKAGDQRSVMGSAEEINKNRIECCLSGPEISSISYLILVSQVSGGNKRSAR